AHMLVLLAGFLTGALAFLAALGAFARAAALLAAALFVHLAVARAAGARCARRAAGALGAGPSHARKQAHGRRRRQQSLHQRLLPRWLSPLVLMGIERNGKAVVPRFCLSWGRIAIPRRAPPRRR